MTKIKNSLKNRAFLYTVIFAAVIILFHISFNVYSGDDMMFANALKENNLFEYLGIRYETWSSRTVVEGLLALLAPHIGLWRILNAGVYALLAYSLYKLTNKSSLLGVYIFILIYPITYMGSAGWIATMLNYMWPVAFGMYSLVALNKLAHNEPVRWWEIVLSFLAMLVGTSTEQYCAAQLVILIIYSAYIYMKNNSRRVLLIPVCQIAVTAANMIYILTSPGNAYRTAVEVPLWMPEFYNKNILDKFIDGFEFTMSRLLSSDNIIFLVFLVFIFICVWKKTKSRAARTISGIPVFICLLTVFGNLDGSGYLSSFTGLIRGDAGVNAATWNKFANYMPVFLYALLIVCVMASFFWLFDDVRYGVGYSFIFLTGIGTGIIMGFSSSMSVSSDRVFLIAYVLMMYIALKLYGNVKNRFSLKEMRLIKYAGIIICAAFVLNNLAAIATAYGSM